MLLGLFKLKICGSPGSQRIYAAARLSFQLHEKMAARPLVLKDSLPFGIYEFAGRYLPSIEDGSESGIVVGTTAALAMAETAAACFFLRLLEMGNMASAGTGIFLSGNSSKAALRLFHLFLPNKSVTAATLS